MQIPTGFSRVGGLFLTAASRVAQVAGTVLDAYGHGVPRSLHCVVDSSFTSAHLPQPNQTERDTSHVD